MCGCRPVFSLAKRTQWRLFNYFPPLLWSYAVPVALHQFAVLPASSSIYEGLTEYGLLALVCLLLISIDVRQAMQRAGRRLGVMFCGSIGIVLGSAASYAMVKPWLPENSWQLFGGGAKLFRVDLASAAIASAANVGGAATAPVVAAHYDSSRVPLAIFMGLSGYALGNYMVVIAAQLCFWVST